MSVVWALLIPFVDVSCAKFILDLPTSLTDVSVTLGVVTFQRQRRPEAESGADQQEQVWQAGSQAEETDDSKALRRTGESMELLNFLFFFYTLYYPFREIGAALPG